MGLVFTVNLLQNKDLSLKATQGDIFSAALRELSAALRELSAALRGFSAALRGFSTALRLPQGEAPIKKGGPSTPAPEKGKEKALDEPNAGYI